MGPKAHIDNGNYDDITEDDGKELIEISRKAIEDYILHKHVPGQEICKGKFSANAGVFVTIKEGGQLRGCIGFPRGSYSLCEATIKSAIYSATEDPRFRKIGRDELDHLEIEVTVLGTPQLLDQKSGSFLDSIKIGTDGLIVETDYTSGLLLPSVAVEENFSKEEFLSATCIKAGLDEDCWKRPEIRIYRIPGKVFR